MATPGDNFSTLVREVWQTQLQNTTFTNNWLFNQTLFETVQAPYSTTISHGYLYSVSTNATTYNYDDTMPDPDTSSQVRAYFNKDNYQSSVRTFNVYNTYLTNGGSEVEGGSLDADMKALEVGSANLRDLITTTALADIEAQIDSAGNYSDASLSRSTYNFASYEEATSTALTLAHMEDALEALENTSYGPGEMPMRREDLVWLVPRNQLTNVSRLVSGASNFPINYEPMGMKDPTRTVNLSLETVPIIGVPDMTTTSLLLVHKPTTKLFMGRPLELKPKTELADTNIWLLTATANLIATNPRACAKLSNKTA